MTPRQRPIRRPWSAKGFTLLEMAVVLVIIGVVMSAVSVGQDVLQNARDRKAFSSFVAGWQEAFSQYVRATGHLPGDNPLSPGNAINNAVDNVLGGNKGPNSLVGVFLQAGMRLPQGRTATEQDIYQYRDSTGSPQRLTISFLTTAWSVPVNATGPGGTQQFGLANRHLMRIQGLTAELAQQMDVMVDGQISARFGQFRQFGPHQFLSGGAVDWGPLGVTADSESARSLVTAYFEMY